MKSFKMFIIFLARTIDFENQFSVFTGPIIQELQIPTTLHFMSKTKNSCAHPVKLKKDMPYSELGIRIQETALSKTLFKIGHLSTFLISSTIAL